MNYSQTLQYLFEQLPMFQRIGPAAFKKDLTNTIKLCQLLDDPQEKFKSVHIAGTNGKGSVTHIVAAVLQSAGYKVGVYTSPHYKDFRERIKINGEFIGEQDVINFVEQLSDDFEAIKPSFFEITVAMAFDHFVRNKVDIAVIETGLGGRLDSTNVLTPLVSVITNIGYDHEEFLGNTLSAIAFEKAGIIKEKVPAVIGETEYETSPVFIKAAKDKNTYLQFADQHYDLELISKNLNGMEVKVSRDKEICFQNLATDLNGDYQLKNLVTSFCCLDMLKKHFNIPDEAIIKGLANVRKSTAFMGRWQILSREPLIICDSGHNKQGLEEALKELTQIPYNQLYMVLGFVKDKDLGKVLPLMPKEACYHFCKPDIPRGLDAGILKKEALAFQLKGTEFASVNDALDAARSKAQAGDVVFVGGSAFVVAEVL